MNALEVQNTTTTKTKFLLQPFTSYVKLVLINKE